MLMLDGQAAAAPKAGPEETMFEEMARKKTERETKIRSGSRRKFCCCLADEANAINTKSAREKMTALLTLQKASGHFQEDKMIGDFIGRPLEDLKASAPDSKPMQGWMTALVIAFLELECHEEKDLWEMSVDKAKEILQDPTLLEAAKLLVGQIRI